MIRQALAAKLFTVGIALGFANDPGCGSVDSPSSGINAPCTRTKDCKGDLVCEKGVCTSPSQVDAGGDSSADADADG